MRDDERRRRRTREDNATQPLDAGRLSLAMIKLAVLVAVMLDIVH